MFTAGDGDCSVKRERLMRRDEFEKLVFDKFGVSADYPFDEDAVSGVFRHMNSGKWFAIAMNIPTQKLGIDREGRVDVVNLKCPPEIIESLLGTEEGVYRANHMNKMHWLSVTLDGECEDGLIEWLVGVSYTVTQSKKINKRQN